MSTIFLSFIKLAYICFIPLLIACNPNSLFSEKPVKAIGHISCEFRLKITEIGHKFMTGSSVGLAKLINSNLRNTKHLLPGLEIDMKLGCRS
jgi:hypothetical protein